MTGLVLMGLSLLAWAFTPNLLVLLVVLAPLALGGGILNTVINTALTKSVYPEEAGGTLGLSASIESLTRVLAPYGRRPSRAGRHLGTGAGQCGLACLDGILCLAPIDPFTGRSAPPAGIPPAST